MCKCLCEHVLSCLLGIYLGMEFWVLWKPCLIFWGNIELFFQSSDTILCSHQKCMKVLIFHILANTCYYLAFYFIFLIAIRLSVKQYLSVALLCISLMTNDVEYVFRLSVYLFNLQHTDDYTLLLKIPFSLSFNMYPVLMCLIPQCILNFSLFSFLPKLQMFKCPNSEFLALLYFFCNTYLHLKLNCICIYLFIVCITHWKVA